MYPTFFFNFIFIPPPALISGAEAERSGPGDALCGAAEGGASVLVTSPRSANPIGPERALGVRGDHDEKKKEKKRADLKTPDEPVLTSDVRGRGGTPKLAAPRSTVGREKTGEISGED